MRRRAVNVVIDLFDVFAVIALTIAQAKEPLFQNRIAAVPQCQRKTQDLVFVRDAANAVLAPSISTGARLIVSKIVPRIAIGAVIFADGAPLAFTQIWTPFLPIFLEDMYLLRNLDHILLEIAVQLSFLSRASY